MHFFLNPNHSKPFEIDFRLIKIIQTPHLQGGYWGGGAHPVKTHVQVHMLY